MQKTGKIALFLTVTLIGITLWFTMRPSPQKHALDSRGLATGVMATELAKLYPGTRALVISNPFARKSGRRSAIQAVEAAGIAGLKEGFGTSITIANVVFPDIHPDAITNPRAVQYPKSSSTPLSYLIAEDSFDQLHEANSECELIVSLIGFPSKLTRLKTWTDPDAPRYALLLPDLRVLGNLEVLKDGFKRDKLAAFIIPKPGGPDSQIPLRDDPAVEFERRFLLVTAENIDQMIEDYPDKFDILPYPPMK